MIYWKIHSMNIELSKRCHTKILPSNELRKNSPTFHYTGWFIGILIFGLLKSPYTWVGSHPLYITQPTSFFVFIAQICPQLHTTTPPPQTCTRPTSVDSKLFEKRKVKPFAGEEKLGPETRWFDCRGWWEILGKICFTKVFKTGFSKKTGLRLKKPGWKGKLQQQFCRGNHHLSQNFGGVFLLQISSHVVNLESRTCWVKGIFFYP